MDLNEKMTKVAEALSKCPQDELEKNVNRLREDGDKHGFLQRMLG
jgi:hypothetical protein